MFQIFVAEAGIVAVEAVKHFFQFVKGMNNQNSFDKLATWGNRWLLTNAHVIRHAAVIQVRKRGDHQKFIAKVLCLGVDCDLAILFLGDQILPGDLQHITVNPVSVFGDID